MQIKCHILDMGPFNNFVDKMRGGGGQKMSVFVHAQGIKTVHAGGHTYVLWLLRSTFRC